MVRAVGCSDVASVGHHHLVEADRRPAVCLQSAKVRSSSGDAEVSEGQRGCVRGESWSFFPCGSAKHPWGAASPSRHSSK